MLVGRRFSFRNGPFSGDICDFSLEGGGWLVSPQVFLIQPAKDWYPSTDGRCPVEYSPSDVWAWRVGLWTVAADWNLMKQLWMRKFDDWFVFFVGDLLLFIGLVLFKGLFSPLEILYLIEQKHNLCIERCLMEFRPHCPLVFVRWHPRIWEIMDVMACPTWSVDCGPVCN